MHHNLFEEENFCYTCMIITNQEIGYIHLENYYRVGVYQIRKLGKLLKIIIIIIGVIRLNRLWKLSREKQSMLGKSIQDITEIEFQKGLVKMLE